MRLHNLFMSLLTLDEASAEIISRLGLHIGGWGMKLSRLLRRVGEGILIETDGEHIHSVFAVANPDKLGALTVLPRKGSQTSFG